MNPFQFKCPARILYGAGKSLDLYQVLQDMGLRNVFILTGKNIKNTAGFQNIIKIMEENQITCSICSETMPEPTVELVDSLADTVRNMDVDGIVAIGGGSILDSAKAVSMLKTNDGTAADYMFGGTKTVKNQALPLICIPTTAGSGSEVTAASVLTDEANQTKASITHEYLIPKIALIDPAMQVSMPAAIAASTGMDALTHAIEAFVSKHSNPMSDMYAREAISLIGKSLRRAVFFPEDMEAKGNMALASTLAAVAFMNGGLGAVHGISQSMGGIAHVSHGVGNALMLPYVMEVNIKGNVEKFAEIAKLLGETTEGFSIYEAARKAVSAVKAFVEDLNIPQNLQQVNVTKEMFPAIIKGTMEYRLLTQNPVPFDEHIVSTILEKAYE